MTSTASRYSFPTLTLGRSDPGRFEYTPGKGIICSLDGEQIVVGSRGLLEEQHVDPGTFVSDANHSSEGLVARNSRLLGVLHIEDASECGHTRQKRLFAFLIAFVSCKSREFIKGTFFWYIERMLPMPGEPSDQ
jgi:hypothetical protein